ncbi:MAG TPA: GNAT family N-acetyltransferase [Panacibacter sp.]|nr:GNAT family N-acetyltransferase [Panacibacter sp.]HNP43819.1 GNAT family N-acetyltransferase [Panacibacter sp.]
MKKQIDIISSSSINREKWNNCIRNSSNPIIYAYSYYLDHIAENWHGVIVNDYEAVLPIPWKRKFGIRYCYHIPFVQQLGIFSTTNLEVQDDLLKNLFRFVRYGDYIFNHGNSWIKNMASHNNYILNLSPGYGQISALYKKDLSQNLKKASREDIIYTQESIENAIQLYKELYSERTAHVVDGDYNNFLSLCNTLAPTGNAFARKIVNIENDTLAVVLLLKDEHRLYNIMNSTTEAGRKTEANHLLFDRVFNEFAGSNMLFDFEGSDIPGIKNFYEKFGAQSQPYYSIHFNRLPFPLRLLKQ